MLDRCLKVSCSKCPDLVGSRSRIVPGYGNPKASLMIIGLAPGRLGADMTGVPFTRDASGRLLQEALIETGLSDALTPENEEPRLETYITNLVKCNPRDLRGRNRDPIADEIANCLEYLNEEIDIVDPTHIIALGVTTFNLLTHLKDLQNGGENGVGIKARISFAYHPAFAVRGGAGRLKQSQYPAHFQGVLDACGYTTCRRVEYDDDR